MSHLFGRVRDLNICHREGEKEREREERKERGREREGNQVTEPRTIEGKVKNHVDFYESHETYFFALPFPNY